MLIESETPRALNSRQSDPFLLSSLSGCGEREGKDLLCVGCYDFSSLILVWVGLASFVF